MHAHSRQGTCACIVYMAQYFVIHPDNPQRRLIQQAAAIVRSGGLIVYPTDSCYALGCPLGDKAAQERIRAIRQLDAHHHFTLVCRDLSQISHYARVDNRVYRMLKASTPGSYTFILRATREVPRRLQNPKRNTIGLRIPDHRVVQALLEELGEPLLSSTLLLPGDALPLNDAQEIRARLERQVDLVLDGGSCGVEMTTVVDLTGDAPEVVREGKGNLEPFGVLA
jgi:tRNA threonylcarbamoyl adenosine modification protein (Sua5/YciO/YrdC/YwlC family)